MNYRLFSIKINTPIWLGISLLSMIIFTSCASKHVFLTSTVTPAARGFVTIKKDNNQNYAIHMEVKYLTEADRLLPARQTYVVWLVTKEVEVQNMGQINNIQTAGSNNLSATFETVSVHEPRRIFITAENDPAISYPEVRIILSTGILSDSQ